MRTITLLLAICATATADHIATDWQLNQGLPPIDDEFCVHMELPVEITNNLNETRTEPGIVDWCFTAGQTPAIEDQRITITGPSFAFDYGVADAWGIEHHQYGGEGHVYSMTLGWNEDRGVPNYVTPMTAGGQELFGPATGTLLLNRSPYQEVGPDRGARLFESMTANVMFDFKSTTGEIRRISSFGSVSSPAAVPEPSAFVMLTCALLGLGVIKRTRRKLWSTE